jgi:SPFH domain / Band 7 family
MLEIICVVGFVAIALCLSSIKLLKDYERLVIFRAGLLAAIRGPGPQIVWPFIETYRKIDLRVVTLPVIAQGFLTRDNVAVVANAVFYYQITDPKKAVLHIEDYKEATEHAVLNVFKDTLKLYDLNELTQTNKRINKVLKSAIDPVTGNWGIRISELTLSINGAPVSGLEGAVEPVSSDLSVSPVLVAAEISATSAAPAVPVAAATSEAPDKAVAALDHKPEGEHHHNHDHNLELAHHRKHKHAHYSYSHGTYELGNHAYEFGHEKKTDSQVRPSESG